MKTSIKFLVLFFSLIFSFSLILGGVTGDTFYWLNRTYFYQEEPLTAFTIWLINIWTSLTERSIFSYRILGWMTCIISICIPYFSLLKKKEYTHYLHLLAAGIILFATGTYKLFNPDTTTVLCLSFIFTLLIKYYKTQNIWFVFISSIIAGVSIAFRFPNVVVVPLIFILFLAHNCFILKKRNIHIYIQALLTAVISLIVYLVLIKVLCNSNDVISLIAYKIQNPTEGANSHNLSYIITNYKNSFMYQMGFISTTFIVTYIIKSIYEIKRTNLTLVVLSLLFLLGLFIIVNKAIDIFALTVIIYVCYIAITTKGNPKLQIQIYTLVGLALVGIAGSDTGISKIYPFIAISIPVLLVYYLKTYKVTLLEKGLFLTFLIYTIIQNTDSMLQNNRTVNYYPLHHIHVTQKDADYWNDIMNDIKDYRNENIIFYGVYGHSLYTISNAKPVYTYSFWMYKDDQQELNRMFTSIKRQPNCLLVDLRKNNSPFFNDEIKNLQMKLVKTTNKYNIYYYKADEHKNK